MTKNTISKTLLAAMLGSSLISAGAFAETTAHQQTESGSVGQKVDSSMNKVGNFMDDSEITARVKAAFIDQKSINSTDISVETNNKVVTLSGFVSSQSQAELAVEIAKKVEGVTSVSDKLHVGEKSDHKTASGSVSDYTGDAVITSKVKAKLLSEGDIASRNIGVETNKGIVQLTGDVKSSAQVAHVESIAKTVEGVKSVKNDLKVEK